jgi:hypothetical protein
MATHPITVGCALPAELASSITLGYAPSNDEDRFMYASVLDSKVLSDTELTYPHPSPYHETVQFYRDVFGSPAFVDCTVYQ